MQNEVREKRHKAESLILVFVNLSYHQMELLNYQCFYKTVSIELNTLKLS